MRWIALYALAAGLTWVLCRWMERDLRIVATVFWPFALVGLMLAGVVLLPVMLLSGVGHAGQRVEKVLQRLRRA